ncbi:hypothetical protein HK097_007933 [Rhizophlyctis rosea]|uniref:Uncharacterized protein n=1 Tax=Rhizophlyctis rosea TaxID=64517 RepID=A0AAD5SCI1_9FUNG|nr:hypothetical protein HK097_007933 [Rhizophlyctis rosea]
MTKYVEFLKQAHKRRLMLCMNEAFYNNLHPRQLFEVIVDLLEIMCDAKSTNITRDHNKFVAKHFPYLIEHERKVIRATLITYSVLKTEDLRRVLYAELMDTIRLWHGYLMTHDVRHSVVEGVSGVDGIRMPLIAYLAMEPWKRGTLFALVDCYAMLPEVVVDLVFPRVAEH